MPEILKLDPQLYSPRHVRWLGDSNAGTGYAPGVGDASRVMALGNPATSEAET